MIETVDFSQKKNDDEDNYARGDVDQTTDSGGRSRKDSIMNNLGEGLHSRIAKNAVDLMDTSVQSGNQQTGSGPPNAPPGRGPPNAPAGRGGPRGPAAPNTSGGPARGPAPPARGGGPPRGPPRA